MLSLETIIEEYFSKDFFWRQDIEKQEKIKDFAINFEQNNPQLRSFVLHNLVESFLDWKIKDISHFLEYNRCYDYVMTRKEDPMIEFIVSISMFGFFQIARQPCTLENGRFVYSPNTEPIDNGESMFCDSVYELGLKNESKNFNWIEKKLLSQKITHLSLTNKTDYIDMPITVKNVLFNQDANPLLPSDSQKR